MSAKTISLAEDAYEALSRMRRPDESFSDIVRRLTRRRSLTELSQIMGTAAASQVADAIHDARTQRVSLRKKRLGLD